MGTNRTQPFGYRMEFGKVVTDPDEARWVVYIVKQEEKQTDFNKNLSAYIMKRIQQPVQRIRKWWLIWKGGGRRWHIMLWETFTVKQIASMRC